MLFFLCYVFSFVTDTAPTVVYPYLHTPSLPDARPNCLLRLHHLLLPSGSSARSARQPGPSGTTPYSPKCESASTLNCVLSGMWAFAARTLSGRDRKSTRLNSSH